jgi:hypothetical protein
VINCLNLWDLAFEALNRWFEANKLSLNFDETHYIPFTTKNSHQIDLDISFANKLISKALDTKFLGIHVDSTLSWKTHFEQIIPKLSAACYAMRSIKTFMSQETLKMVYYAYFHSIVNTIRIITGWRSRDAWRDLRI